MPVDALPNRPVATSRAPCVLEVAQQTKVVDAHALALLAHVVDRHAGLDGAMLGDPDDAVAQGDGAQAALFPTDLGVAV